MGAHIEWILEQHFDIGDTRYTLRFGTLRTGAKLERWLDDWEFRCTVAVFNDLAFFSGGSSEKNAKIQQTELFRERDTVRQLLIPLGVKYAKWTRVKTDSKGNRIQKIKQFKV